MKTTLLITTLFSLSASLFAQGVKQDSVSMGPGYSNQIYYKMNMGQAGTAAVNNWSIAHTSLLMDNNIRANHMSGLQVIAYPKGDNSSWSTFDTSGFRGWKKYYNNIHEHSLGAFMQQFNGNPLDFSWGTYNTGTHIITGDSLYLLAWAAGPNYTKFLKLMLIKQDMGNLIFKYANVDGSSEKTDTLRQSEAANQNYKFYDFNTADNVIREPFKASWDISFARYYAPSWNNQTMRFDMYPVMGVESNVGVKVAKLFGKSFTQVLSDSTNMVKSNLQDSSFTDSMTAIGSDWKTFNGAKFVVNPNQSYIVQGKDNAYWLIHFSAFGGSANGKVVFNKLELVNTSSVKHSFFGAIKVFPNPISGNLYITFEDAKIREIKVSLSNASGKLILSDNFQIEDGFSAAGFNVSNCSPGVYFLNITSGVNSSTQKIIIQ